MAHFGTLVPVGDDEEAHMKDEAAALEAHRSQEAEQHAGSSAHPPAAESGQAVEDEDDDETCGFCRFMKAGGCKDEFNAWSECVDSERSEGRNFTEECAERTGALQTCMEAHREYYEDFLFDSEAAAAAATAALADDASGEADANGGEAAAPQTPEQPDGGPAGDHGAGGSGGKGAADAGGGADEPKDTPDPESDGPAAEDGAPQPVQNNSAPEESKAGASMGGAFPAAGGLMKAVDDAPAEASSAQIDQLTERSLAAGLEMDVPREHAAKVAELGMAIEMRPADAAADEAAAEAPTVQDRVAAAHGDRADGAPQGDSAAAGADAAPQDGAAEGGAAEAQPAGEEDEAEQGAGGDEEGEGGDEEAAEKPVIILRTAPYDPRFPSTNQARNCHTRYQEYHRCMAQTGGDEEKCSPFARAYRSLCPTEWIERWNEAREEGRWTGRYLGCSLRTC